MQGRQYTWSGGETLVQLGSCRDEIRQMQGTSIAGSILARSSIPPVEALAEA